MSVILNPGRLSSLHMFVPHFEIKSSLKPSLTACTHERNMEHGHNFSFSYHVDSLGERESGNVRDIWSLNKHGRVLYPVGLCEEWCKRTLRLRFFKIFEVNRLTLKRVEHTAAHGLSHSVLNS